MTTPDLMARFNKPCHLDKTEHGTVGHDMASVIHGATVIARSPEGPKDKNDKASKHMVTSASPSIGAGGGRLGDAARSIKSGAEAPKVDWAHVKRG